MIAEETLESGYLACKELVRMGSQRGEIAAMVFDLGSDLAHEIDEVLLDHADDMEAIGDDFGVGEVFADEGAVGAAQVHADDPDVILSLKLREVGLQVLWVTAFDDVEDSVGPEIAESGGELGAPPMPSAFSLDGVFVDAEDRRANTVRAFSSFEFGVFVVEAFDGGGSDAFSVGEDATGDAIAVQFIDRPPEGLRGVAILFDARQRRDE